MTGPQADVRSIDAVRDWHAALANYADSLAEALAGVELELRRGYEWLDEQQAALETGRSRLRGRSRAGEGRTFAAQVQDLGWPRSRLHRAGASTCAGPRPGSNMPRSRSRRCGSGRGGCRRSSTRCIAAQAAAATLPRRRSAQGAGGPGAANRLARGVRSAPARLRVGLWAKP